MMKQFYFLLLAFTLTGVFSPLQANSQTIEEARQAASRGEVRESIIQLKNILQQDPENADARFSLGQIYLHYGDAASAEKELRRAQLLGVPATRVSELILDAYLAQGKFDEIAAYLKKQKTDDIALQATFKAFDGFVQLSKKENDKARVLFEEALVLDAENIRATLGLASFYVTTSNDPAAMEILSGLIAKQPDNTKALALRAELYRKTGKLDLAEADFLKVLSLNPNHHKSRLGMAFVQVTKKQPDEALKNIEKLPEQIRQTPMVKYLDAVAYFIKQDTQKSEAYLQEVLKSQPDHLQSHLLLGVIYYSQEKWQLAEDHLRRVSKNMPENSSIAKLLAASYLKLQQPDKAIQLLNKFVSKPGVQDAQLFSLMGSAYLQKGDNSKSQEWLNKAVELAPEQAGVRTQLALGMLAGGNTDMAISALESAVDLGQDLIQTDVLLVMSHLRAGDSKKAVEVSIQLQQKYPDSPIPYNLTGLSYLADRQFDKADQAFVKALEIDPAFEIALLNRARNKIAAGDLDGAQKLFEHALDANPENTTALLGLAQLAVQKGDRQKQIEYLDRIIAIQPSNVIAASQLAEIYIGKNEPLKALTLLSGLNEEQAKNPVVLRLKGMAQISARQSSSAISTLKQLVNQLPDNIEANFQLGRAYLLNNEIDNAKRHFAHATKQDPEVKFPIVWLALAEVDLKQNAYDEVIATTDKLLDAKQQVATVYELRAAAYQGLGKNADLLASLKQAYIIEPTTKRVNTLASFYQKNGHTDKAIEIMSDWVAKHPDDAATQAILGLTYQQQDQDGMAIKAYEASLKQQPENAVIMNNLAWLYYKTGDKRAIKLAKQAYEKAQKRPEIVDTYGWILLENGQPEKALPILQQALLQSPSHPEIAYHVAVAMQQLGRMQEAKPILNRIIRNSPSSPFAEKARQLLAK